MIVEKYKKKKKVHEMHMVHMDMDPMVPRCANPPYICLIFL